MPDNQLESDFSGSHALGKVSAMGKACNAVKDDIENVCLNIIIIPILIAPNAVGEGRVREW